MKALIVYESTLGDTEAIARAVAERLEMSFDVTVADVRTLPAAGDTDLLIVGAPAHAFSMGRHRIRAAWHGRRKSDASEIGIREYLGCSPWLTGVHAAAFDTTLRKPSLPGSAARKAYRRLDGLGCHMLTAAKSFHVASTAGPLLDGELDRARRWADTVAAIVLAGRRPASTT